jgi:uncharacterized protein YndB with AHSA1/START domain
VATWKQQALIEAPVEMIWSLLGNPERYAEWAADSVAVTGVPTEIQRGSTFQNTSPGLIRGSTTTFKVEELEDLREIKLRCQMSGYYSHWRLTEARGETFTDVEFGVEPIGLQGRLAQVAMTKHHLRQVADESLDGLRRAAGAGEAGEERE